MNGSVSFKGGRKDRAVVIKPSLLLVVILFFPLATLNAATTAVAPTNRLEFLPEVERVLDTHGALGARAYLSFSNGMVAEEASAENPQRNRQLHRDLKLQTIEGEQEWTGVDLQFAPATEAMWNTPPDQLVAALADNLAPPLPTMQVTPGVWFFQTRDGTYGLLRVVGFVEPRPGYQAMKVVYKLARRVSAQKPAPGSFAIQLDGEVPGKIMERKASLDLPMIDRINQFVEGAPGPNYQALLGPGAGWFDGPVVQLDGSNTNIAVEVIRIPMPVPAHNSPGSRDDFACYLRSANCFYLAWSEGALSMRLYGPFRGDPVEVLGLFNDWGGEVDGISFGLEAKKTVWASDETPELVARVRNQGSKASVVQWDQGWARLEVDGVLYNHHYIWDVEDGTLRAGEEVDNIKVTIGPDWDRAEATKREGIKLAPGKHIVRVRYDWDDGHHTVSDRDIAFSNPVEIEIVDKPAAK